MARSCTSTGRAPHLRLCQRQPRAPAAAGTAGVWRCPPARRGARSAARRCARPGAPVPRASVLPRPRAATVGRLSDQGHGALSLPALTDRSLQSLQSGVGGSHALLAMQPPGGFSSGLGGLGGGGAGAQQGGREGLSMASLAGLSGVRSPGQVLSPLSGVSGLLASRQQMVFPAHSAAMHHQPQPQEQEFAARKPLQEDDALTFLSEVSPPAMPSAGARCVHRLIAHRGAGGNGQRTLTPSATRLDTAHPTPLLLPLCALCVCVHAHTHSLSHTHTHTTQTHTCMHACMYITCDTYMYIRICAYTHAHTQVRARFQHKPHVYQEFLSVMRGFKVHTHTHTHTQTRTHARAHTHTHAHKCVCVHGVSHRHTRLQGEF